MKTFFLITVTVLLSSFVSQPDEKTQPDPRLYDDYFLDNSFKIIEQPKGKKLELPTVVIPDIQHFNILVVQKRQKLQRNWDNQTYYSIKNTDKILVFISEKEFTQRLNKHIEH
jgi:hypothetical protein